MPITVIDTIKQKNNGKFPVAHSNDVKGGAHQVRTHEERDAIPRERLTPGMFCYVEDGEKTYQLKPDYTWKEFESAGAGSVHIGADAPQNTNVVWVDNTDENIDASIDSSILDNIREALKSMNDKISDMHYSLNYEIDSGYFNEKYPGEDDEEVETLSEEEPEFVPDFGGVENEEGYEPDVGKGPGGNVKRIKLKRGLKEELENLFEGELGFTLDTQELYIGLNGRNIRLAKGGGGTSGGDASNVTGDYLELVASNNQKYRLTVNDDGQLIVFPSEAYTVQNPALDESPRYKGLIINHVYGGGSLKANVAPCSHGFIELYNSSTNPINLKGLSLQYGEPGKPWQVFPLTGIVKPLHSFLVRCAEHTDIYRKTCRFKIWNYDMHWDIPLSSNGMKVYLGIGTTPLEVKNPANIDNLWTKQQGYIDLFAFGSTNPALSMDAYEKNDKYDGYIKVADMLTSVHRKDFLDTDSSFYDLEPIDLTTADVSIYTPRCTRDGQWTNYYNKLKLSELKPTMINMCCGQDGDTTRTFTWHTKPTLANYFLYKKEGDEEFTWVETETEPASYYDTDATIHKVIIRDLTPGNYIYKCGEEGMWSDEYKFEIKRVTNEDKITILFTTDQQGINQEEYEVWKKANDIINENETYDIHINTGDISNDGIEFAYQWRYYYEFAKQDLYTKPHMTACGNNDLTRNDQNGKKTNPVAFGWYFNYENQHIPSCYSWNYGYIHFVCLNSNKLQASDIVEQQLPWLREDLSKPENQKRWTIVYMHESPYTIIRQKNMVPFVEVFNEFGVDLVLCGHHHRYSRTHRLGAEVNGVPTIDNERGTYYVMCQATGYKLMGKTTATPSAEAPWRAKFDNVGNPMFIMWDITYDKIVMRPYSIANILPETSNTFNKPELLPFSDSLEITKS